MFVLKLGVRRYVRFQGCNKKSFNWNPDNTFPSDKQTNKHNPIYGMLYADELVTNQLTHDIETVEAQCWGK